VLQVEIVFWPFVAIWSVWVSDAGECGGGGDVCVCVCVCVCERESVEGSDACVVACARACGWRWKVCVCVRRCSPQAEGTISASTVNSVVLASFTLILGGIL
jgi:hypothetical protein